MATHEYQYGATVRDRHGLRWGARFRRRDEYAAVDDVYLFIYQVGFLAVDWLVTQTSEEALMDYFRKGGNPRAVKEAFGMSQDEFHTTFKEHHAEVAPPFEWQIEGTVLGPDGESVRDMLVTAVVRLDGEPYWAGDSYSSADGEFTFSGPGGGYTLGVSILCPGGTSHGGPWHTAGEWGAGGFTTERDGATPFEGDGRHRTGIVIQLPQTPAEIAREHC